MADSASDSKSGPIPFGQRMADSPFLLLIAGMVCMLAFYTIWGLYEVMSLPQATLP